MMRRIAHWTAVQVTCLIALATSAFAGGALPQPFTLGRCIPADSWLYVHGVSNPERAWIDAKWGEVFAELKKSGVDQDAVKLVMSMLGDTERETAQAAMDKVVTLIRGVNWSDLGEKEFVFAERPSGSMLGFDYIAVVRGKAGSGEHNAAGLVAILKEAATATGATLSQSKLHDTDVWELSHEALHKIGLTVALFRQQDTIGLLTGRKTLEYVVGALAGKESAKPLIETPRFQEALNLVQPPADAVVYADLKLFFQSLRSMFQNIQKRAVAENVAAGIPNPDRDKGLQIMVKFLDRVDVFDVSIASVATKDTRQVHWDAIRFQSGKEDAPLSKAILNRKPFAKFDQFIPAEATAFSLAPMVDFEILYEMVLDFLAQEIPDGKTMVEKWKAILASANFDPKADLFAWWSGEMASITMPPAVVTPMSSSDSVLMIRVKNSSLAKEKIDAAVNLVKTKMKEEGQALMITPAKLEVEGFREITHPSIAMFFKPVIGVHGDWLMVGSSTGALQKCLQVEAGKAPSVTKNDRFSKEGLLPKGQVRAASFEDTSKTGQELAAALGMLGMFGPMMLAGMPETNAEEKQVKQFFESGIRILVKLAPVLQKIDFYSSASSVSSFDGKATLKTESVVTYKKTGPGAETVQAPK